MIRCEAPCGAREGCRCFTFIGLLVGCYEGEDGSLISKAYPWLNCDQIDGRVATGVAFTTIFCAGVPALMIFLAVQFHRQKIQSALSVFIIRSIFSGHRPTMQGMMYRIWTLLRSLSFICISQSTLNDQQQALGLFLLLTVTMLLESILEPRMTRAMSLLDRFEELVIFVVICLGMLHSGSICTGIAMYVIKLAAAGYSYSSSLIVGASMACATSKAQISFQ